MATATTTRPRISEEFLEAHRRTRLIDGLSRCIIKQGYRAMTVTDVVREAKTTRNTFYDTFSSKEAAALTMTAAVCPVLDVGDKDVDADGAIVLAIELAARLRTGDQIGATALIADAEQLLDRKLDLEPLEPAGTDDAPLLSTLPPGRHGLPREFVRKNQLARLLAGTAKAIYETGYAKATIADITRHAAVSRRTFYEHFVAKEAAVIYMAERAEEQLGLDLADHDFGRGLDQLWAEVVAAAFAGDAVGSMERRKRGQAVVRMLGAQLEVAEAA
jgi:AcrR family transcriptional regulator